MMGGCDVCRGLFLTLGYDAETSGGWNHGAAVFWGFLPVEFDNKAGCLRITSRRSLGVGFIRFS